MSLTHCCWEWTTGLNPLWINTVIFILILYSLYYLPTQCLTGSIRNLVDVLQIAFSGVGGGGNSVGYAPLWLVIFYVYLFVAVIVMLMLY